MADTKRPREANDRRKKKYRSDGTPIWGKRYIDGPGVWVSCVKGKEKQAIGECYEIFESVASDLWPTNGNGLGKSDAESDSDEGGELSIEAQIANEVSAMKRPKTEPRFVNCQTNTPCVAFISCKPPVDPVKLITKLVKDVEDTGVVQSRYIHRLVPVSGSCVANLPEIKALCSTILAPYFAQYRDKTVTYKIELRVRNHSVISRPVLIQNIAQCVPERHTVSLDNPEIFILVEVFKSICGISVVEDYYRLQKFNIMEIANAKNGGDLTDQGRVFLPKDAASKDSARPQSNVSASENV